MAVNEPEVQSGRVAQRWRGALWLTVAAAVCAGVLAWVEDLTADRIAENIAANERAALMSVLPDVRFDNDPLTDYVDVTEPTLLGTTEPVRIYRIRRGDVTLAVIISAVAPDGYVGPINLLVAIRPDGRISGVAVTAHRETPGLGDRIEPGKSDWLSTFTGRSLDDPPPEAWRVARDGGDFDQLTGATITTRTVVGSVRDSLIYFREHQAALSEAQAEAAAE